MFLSVSCIDGVKNFVFPSAMFDSVLFFIFTAQILSIRDVSGKWRFPLLTMPSRYLSSVNLYNSPFKAVK